MGILDKCTKCGHALSMHIQRKCNYILKIDDITLQPTRCGCQYVE